MSRQTQEPAGDGRRPNSIVVNAAAEESSETALARTVLTPTVQAAATLRDYNANFGNPSLEGLTAQLMVNARLASDGDMRRGEEMLVAQAHTLDAIFNKLARRAANAEYLSQVEVNLRLALKAQSQCRATIEALAEIKNPRPLAFVRQANISAGPQQVNNGVQSPSRAEESAPVRNEVLEASDGERLDTGAESGASRGHSAMAAVGAVNRPADR